MITQIAAMLCRNLIADGANVSDAGVLGRIEVVQRFGTHGGYSNRIKSGVTNSGSRSLARAAMIVRCVRLFGFARCF